MPRVQTAGGEGLKQAGEVGSGRLISGLLRAGLEVWILS